MKNDMTTKQKKEFTLDILGLITRCVETSKAEHFDSFDGHFDMVIAHAKAIEESMGCGKCKKKKTKKKAARK